MQTLGLLLETESHAFVKRIPVFLPLIHQCLLTHKHGGTVAVASSSEGGTEEREEGEDESHAVAMEEEEEGGEINGEEEGEDGGVNGEGEGDTEEGVGNGRQDGLAEEDRLKESDRLLFSALSTLGRMCRECDLFGGTLPVDVDMKALWGMSVYNGIG